MTLPALRAQAVDHPGSYPVQMALGRALQEAKETDEAVKAYERAAKLIPIPAGKDSPHALIAAIAIEKKDTARAIAELQALVAVDFDNVGAARRLASLMQDRGHDPATLGRSTSASWPSIRSTPTRTASSAGSPCSATSRTSRRASSARSSR